MKVFFDTEFTELNKNAELISIGLLAENGKQFYAEIELGSLMVLNDWVKQNVLPYTIREKRKSNKIIQHIEEYHVGGVGQIGEVLHNWLLQFEMIELVSDVCHYDMVLFADLFGGAEGIPKHVAPVCYDICQDIAMTYKISMQEAFDLSREKILKDHRIVMDGEKHNALYDAKVIKAIYEILHQDGVIE